MFAQAEREPMLCPSCKKELVPHDIVLYSSTDNSFFELEPIGEGHCSKCSHEWKIYDMFYLENNGKITIQRSN
jgi:hypothetical protein